MKPRVYLAAVGDANSPVTWSGIPYHFLQAGKAKGLFDEGLALSAESREWQARRVSWNLMRLFHGDRRGGYQYSISFLERLWAPVQHKLSGFVVVNCFQLFAPSVIANQTVEKWFFIDQTLTQLFDHYGLGKSVGRRIAGEAIEREREGYHAARGVIVHSNWAARSVAGDYGVPRDRIHVVVPGANLDPAEYARWEIEEEKRRRDEIEEKGRPLRLVFVGKEWHRKGVDRLLRAVRLARHSGAKITLRIIGCRRESLPQDLRDSDGVEWLGFIDKRAQAAKFLRAVSECDIGCLISRAEAGGIAIREYHALGLPVVGTDAGGAPEHMIPGGAVLVSAQASDQQVSETLLAIEQNTALLEQLRRNASNARCSALWSRSVEAILEFWPHGQDLRVPQEVITQAAPDATQVSVA